MYRIELAPGEEAALRTVDELAAGIRTGIITSRARIWHNAGQKWLPIEFHPHYQAALKQVEAEALPAAAVAFPVPSASREPPSVPAHQTTEPGADSAVATFDPAPEPPSAVREVTSAGRSLRRPIVLAVVGATLIVSARMVASATAMSADEPTSAVAHMAATVARLGQIPVTRSVVEDSAQRAGSAPAAPAITPTVLSVPTNPAPPPEPVAKATAAAHTIGGVVRGPDPSAVVPARTPRPMGSEDTPEITPAPVVTELPMPPLPTDSTN